MLKKRHAVAILVVTPQGIPLVRDTKKRFSFWKLPGGHSEGSETPDETAARELEEETGIVLSPYELEQIYQEDRRTHNFFVFRVDLPKLPPIQQQSNEGEEVGLFDFSFFDSQEFSFGHQAILKKIFLRKPPEI